ncbi:MAG: AbrB/MazE/SpoVT family DNA-binding domain-containing protein [Candidatus Kuenenia sp.]|nr:AbrB/MazE/SpoVT family DNA-binding domain-containing protein [Candidatus Kuenenia hertensis]
MITKLQKWGNSQGIRISMDLLKEAHLNIGDEVEVKVSDEKIIIETLHKVRGKYDIHNLVKKIPGGYKSKETVWGKPTGKEAW